MAGTPNRLSIPPEVRREVENHVSTLDGLTFSSTPTQAEVEALRDAISDALNTVFGQVD